MASRQRQLGAKPLGKREGSAYHRRMEDAEILVLGGSGLVGAHVLRQLFAAARPAYALTRAGQPPPALASMARWHCGAGYDLDRGLGPWPAAQRLISAGPLTGLANWLERSAPPGLHRLVALGSTSVATKTSSPDPAERALARRLADAEARVRARCQQLGIAWTLLRPTLIWGDGRDLNLSRLAAQARRHGFIALPSFARGRRQPIHAAEVAQALLRALDAEAAQNREFDLPGGQTLAYDRMARRIAKAVAPPGRVLRVPGWLLRPVLALAPRLRLLPTSTAAMIARSAQDLVFDGEPAWQALAWRPGAFRPRNEDFPQP